MGWRKVTRCICPSVVLGCDFGAAAVRTRINHSLRDPSTAPNLSNARLATTRPAQHSIIGLDPEIMHLWLQIVRFMALALLLLTGGEVLACDLVSPAYCKLSGAQHGTTSGQDDSGGDTCLCCCTHYIAPVHMNFVQFDAVGVPPVLVPVRSPLPEPACILHPPRA